MNEERNKKNITIRIKGNNGKKETKTEWQDIKNNMTQEKIIMKNNSIKCMKIGRKRIRFKPER